MELTKEIELIILTKVAQKGKVTGEDFDQLFADNNFEYNLALSRIFNANSTRISEINQCGNITSHYQISEFGELRRRTLQKEKNNEKATGIIQARLTKHIVIVRKGRKFLIMLSFLTLLAAMYLIHLESINRHFQSPSFKTIMVR